MPASNSTFAIGGVSCSADSLVVAGSFEFRIKLIRKNPAHGKSAKRSEQAKTSRTNSTFGFLPTKESKLKNQKSYF